MIEQTDDRILTGIKGRYSDVHALGPFTGRSTFMGGFRADYIDLSLWHSPNRMRLAPRVISDVREQNLFVWLEEEIIFSPQWRAQLGLRADAFRFDVTDSLEGIESDLPHASGYDSEGIVSPKASLVFSPTESLDLFVNGGSGFHSNDARGVIIGKRTRDLARQYEREGLTEEEIEEKLIEQNLDPDQRYIGTIPRALGAEVGFRTQFGRTANLAVAGWLLDLENEFVYSGDGGAPELSGASFRYGVDVEARLRLARWLFLDANVNYSKGRFKDEPEGFDEIPLAPRLTSIGGLTYVSGTGLNASLRYRHVDDRPATEDGSITALGYTIVDITASYQLRSLKLSMQLENLLDDDWNEAQFATESRLKGELEPVEELHFTPGTPLAVRFGLAYLF
jgi:outer membrane receptor protein involved in Fe transport